MDYFQTLTNGIFSYQAMSKKKELSEFYAGFSLADPRATWDE